MPAKIRLQRHGKKGKPFYHIVIADGRAPRDGRFIEKIGTYNPITTPADITLDVDKALVWLNKGAQPTDTVRTILSYKGVLYRNHLLKGVKKGAFTEEQAEAKYQAWLNEKEAKTASEVSDTENAVRTDRKNRLEAEVKIKNDRAAIIAKRLADEAGIVAAAAAEKAAAEAPVKTVEEKADEAPVEEAKVEEKSVEAPVKEVKAEEAPVKEAKAEEAPVKEAKTEEAPAKEAKTEEAPAKEAKVEEVKAEKAPAKEAKVEETPAEEPKAKEEEKKED